MEAQSLVILIIILKWGGDQLLSCVMSLHLGSRLHSPLGSSRWPLHPTPAHLRSSPTSGEGLRSHLPGPPPLEKPFPSPGRYNRLIQFGDFDRLLNEYYLLQVGVTRRSLSSGGSGWIWEYVGAYVDPSSCEARRQAWGRTLGSHI